jgi:signal transduction histidine kinase
MRDIEHKISVAKTRMIYQSSLPASFVLTLMAPMAVYAFTGRISETEKWTILALLTLPAIYRLVLNISYYRFYLEERDRFWENSFHWLTLLIGAAWGFSSIYVFKLGDISQKFFILVCIASMMAAGAFIYASKLKTAMGYEILNTLPVAMILFTDDIQFFQILGFFALFYTGVILHGTWVFNKRIDSSYRLQFTRDELVSELKNKNEEIIQEQQKVVHSSRLAAVGEMSAGIAHEINNPMTVIITMAKQMEKNIDQPEKLTNFLGKIIRNSERIIKIVNSLRRLSRSERQDEMSPVNVEEVIQGTLDLCIGRIHSDKINLELKLHKDLYVLGNEIQLSQVILNLINNAIDVIEEQMNEEGNEIRIIMSVENNNLHLDVVNSGPLISDDVKAKLFLPFFTTKQVGQGTGLGLSLSKQMIENQDGTLTLLENTEQTTFRISMPLIGAQQEV